MFRKIILTGLSFVLAVNMVAHAASAPNQPKPFHSIVVPGQNGKGGASFHYTGINPLRPANTSSYSQLRSKIDFGQENCIKHFEDTYQSDERVKDKERIFYGVSQGTAILINWLAKQSHVQQEENARAVVLEGVMGSGNRAIDHTVESISKQVLGFSPLTYFPLSRVWMPLLAKAFYPSYKPWGMQAQVNAQKLSPNIPVVIIHNQRDFQLPVNDARRLYYTLREQGNQSAYLVEAEDSNEHLDVLCFDKRAQAKLAAIQKIYRKHDLPLNEHIAAGGKGPESEIANYQPDLAEVRARIKQTDGYKPFVRNIIDVAACAAIVGGIYYKCRRK